MSKAENKFSEVEQEIYTMDLKKGVFLSIMSMMRTNRILDTISNQQEFKKINKLTVASDIILDYMLNHGENELDSLEKLSSLCEEMIPIMENFHYRSLTGDISYIVGCTRSLLEKWFYYTNFTYNDIQDYDRESFLSFIFIGLETIESFLSPKYWNKTKDTEKVAIMIDESVLLNNEIKRIDDDIAFLKSKDSEVEMIKYVEKYRKIDIL